MTFRGRYAGTPYVERGRSIEGADCWGLVCVVYLEEAGIVLPDHGEISARDLLAVARAMEREKRDPESIWTKVKEGDVLRPLDLVVMRAPGGNVPIHVGVHGVRDGVGQVLHTEIETDAAWSRFDHPSLSGRVIGFWRHRDLAGWSP